jgi:L-threonylcarbamoyladenylate synthase
MKILKVDKKNLRKVVRITEKSIKKGEVVLCPTDTVYGILADATNKKAVERVFKIKKRPKGKPIPIFVKDIKMAKKLAFINKKQEDFLKMVWPGKVTVVLKRRNVLPKILSGRTKTIGLRIPDYKLVNNLLLKLNRPLTGTSANISGKPASTKIKEVIKQFKKEKTKPDLILDAGNLKPSSPSRVIDLTGKKFKILRR